MSDNADILNIDIFLLFPDILFFDIVVYQHLDRNIELLSIKLN